MEIHIRKMNPEDWEAVADIYQRGLDSGIASFETQVPSWVKWDQKYHKVCRWVAEENNTILGWVAISPVSAREVYRGVAEVSIYIDPEKGGKGIGQKLFKHLIEDSEKEGFWTLHSGIFPQNTASIRLHEKMGFRKIGYRERVAQRGGKWYDNLLME
ncbi:MAG: N-acetyltransferase family protein, partial [Bacteroidota bacterium]